MLSIYVLEGQREPDARSSDALSLVNEYAKSDCTTDLVGVLRQAGYATSEVRSVTLSTIDATLDAISSEARAAGRRPVVFNLCDGIETDGYPGVSVPRACAARGLAFTGADEAFFAATTAKTVMKRRFAAASVPTAAHLVLTRATTAAEIDALASYPLLVKPSVSYASLGVTDESVVHTAAATLAQAEKCRADVIEGEVFAESFLAGREFTALIVDDNSDGDAEPVCVPVAERIFDATLPQSQRFLAFNRYWNGYVVGATQAAADAAAPLYAYALAPPEAQANLMRIACAAYRACAGRGYARVDIRTRAPDDNECASACVLEVNSQPGLSFERNTSSMAEILSLGGMAPVDFVRRVVNAAVRE